MNRPSWKKLLRLAVIVAVLVFLGIYLYRDAAKLRDQTFTFSLMPFLLSTALYFIIYPLQVVVWWRSLIGVAHPIKFREALAIWFASQVAKYVPGKVMLPLVRMTLCKRKGIDIGRTTMSIYLELAMMNGGVIVIFLLSALFWPDNGAWTFIAEKVGWTGNTQIVQWIVMLLVPLSLIGIHPKILQWFINLGLRLLKKDPVAIEIGYGRMLQLFLIDVLGWAIYGYACWLLIVSLGTNDPAMMMRVVSAFTLSWLIGFLSFVTPGGIGVREAILTGLLVLWQVPASTAVAAALLSRLQWTGVELIGAALTFRYRPLAEDGQPIKVTQLDLK